MHKNITILKQQMLFCIISSVLFLLTACTDTNSTAESIKTYDIPEIDKLSLKITKSPNNATFYATRSLLFTEYELYQEAELDAEKALQLDSTKVDYYRLLTNAYMDNNHSLSAIKTAENAIIKFPENIDLYLLLSEIQYILQQYQDGLLTIDKMTKIAPNHPEGLYIQGQIFKEMGDTIKALDRFQTVVEQDADHIDAYIQLGLLSQNRSDGLNIRYLDNALRIDSMNETALLAKAQYYHLKGDFENAQKEYKVAILRSPQNENFNYNIALMYLEMGDIASKKVDLEKSKEYYKNAFQHFDNCTKFAVQFADAYYYKGISAERLGKKDIALSDYENALRLQAHLGTISPEVVEASIQALQ